MTTTVKNTKKTDAKPAKKEATGNKEQKSKKESTSKSKKEPSTPYFAFLFQLQKNSQCNMFGAAPILMAKFPDLDQTSAESILLYWLENNDRIAKK